VRALAGSLAPATSRVWGRSSVGDLSGGAHLGVVMEKLYVVTNGGWRKLSVVTDGEPAKGRRYYTSTRHGKTR
jgi:hypothetical protein